jgi:DNA polymerase-1
LTVFFDIETNGLLEDCDRVICIAYAINNNPVTLAHEPVDIKRALALLAKADMVVAHNGIAFDLPVLRKLYPKFKGVELLRDTLVMSRLAYPDIRLATASSVPPTLAVSHSLKAWGHRLNMHKGVYLDSVSSAKEFYEMQYSPELGEYCMQDVEITRELFRRLDNRLVCELDAIEALIIEHDFAQNIQQQMQNGFAFDEQAAAELYAALCEERDQLHRQLQEQVPPRVLVMKTKTKEIPFNPSSRQQIADYLQTMGWVPESYTPSGQPQIDESVLSEMDFPIAKLLSRYLLLVKRIGMLAEGTEAWMKSVRKGRIHGYVNHNGAVTGRCTHRSPNMAQVPSVGSPFGKECRSLFVARPGYLMVGVDASGLELRCLGHYMAKYDDGAFVKELLEGDIHTANQKAAGLPTRDAAKSFIYAFLYGAGPAKLGALVGGNDGEGRRMQRQFLAKVPALRSLKTDVEQIASTRQYLIGLDGRPLPVRSVHSALNTLLQSAGAVVMKVATNEMNRRLAHEGIDYRQVGHIHDEVQFEVAEADADRAATIVAECIRIAGEELQFRCPLAGESRVGKNWAETH